jgi:hypothetical protein
MEGFFLHITSFDSHKPCDRRYSIKNEETKAESLVLCTKSQKPI